MLLTACMRVCMGCKVLIYGKPYIRRPSLLQPLFYLLSTGLFIKRLYNTGTTVSAHFASWFIRWQRRRHGHTTQVIAKPRRPRDTAAREVRPKLALSFYLPLSIPLLRVFLSSPRYSSITFPSLSLFHHHHHHHNHYHHHQHHLYHQYHHHHH